MLPVNPDPVIGADQKTFGDECAEDDWDCNKTTWMSFFTETFRRLAAADFSNFNGDFLISVLFLAGCILSWQIVQFVFRKVHIGNKPFKNEVNQQPYRNSGSFNATIPADDSFEQTETSAEAEVQPDTADVRAAGDSWEQDEYDPDYDANNEIMVMLLQGTQEDSEDVTPIRSETEGDEGLLEELTRPEDEVQMIEIQNEANDTVDLQATNQEEDSGGTTPKEESQPNK